VLSALARLGEAKPEEVTDALTRFGIDPALPDPWSD
jgi:hypothetical protein